CEAVRYVRGPRRGLGANENHIVANLLTETDWVLFNGDDARLSPEYIATLRRLLARYASTHRIPSGIEIRDGTLVRPNRLDFLGFQSRLHPDYVPGRTIETVVIQSTPLPHEA